MEEEPIVVGLDVEFNYYKISKHFLNFLQLKFLIPNQVYFLL